MVWVFPALDVPAMAIVLYPEHGVAQGEYKPADRVDMVVAGASIVTGSLIVYRVKVRSKLVSFVQ
jgi:hypothetical protein